MTAQNAFTPAELAEFDQQWRGVERALDALLRAYRNKTSDGEATREVDLMCFTMALPEIVEAEDCAALLACAVARLAERGPSR